MAKYSPSKERNEKSDEGPKYQLGVCAVNRCCGIAALSHSTKGGGPFYCARHFRDPRSAPMTLSESESDRHKRMKANATPMPERDARQIQYANPQHALSDAFQEAS